MRATALEQLKKCHQNKMEHQADIVHKTVTPWKHVVSKEKKFICSISSC